MADDGARDWRRLIEEGRGMGMEWEGARRASQLAAGGEGGAMT
jgi:hypothetical protein